MMGAELVGSQWQAVGLDSEAGLARFQRMPVAAWLDVRDTFYWLGPAPCQLAAGSRRA